MVCAVLPLAGCSSGGAQRTPDVLAQCLRSAVKDVAFPGRPFYQWRHVQRWNLDVEVNPAAVTYPESPEQIAAVVRCAKDAGRKVQPKSGGHSFGNYGEVSFPWLYGLRVRKQQH